MNLKKRAVGFALAAGLVGGMVGVATPAGAHTLGTDGQDRQILMECSGTHTVAAVNPTLKNGFPLFTAFAIKKAVGVYSLLDITQSNPINDNTSCTVDTGIHTEQGNQDVKYIFDNQSNGNHTLSLLKVGGKLVGSATCATNTPDTAAFKYPNSYPANGKLVWKWNETTVDLKNLQTQMYVRLGLISEGDPNAEPPEDPIIGLKGIVLKGVGVGGDVETALSYFPTQHTKNATALNCGTLAASAGGTGDPGEIAQLYSFATEDPNTFDPIPLRVVY